MNQVGIQGAARIANLHDLVVNELLLGDRILVAECSASLSGGLRQRKGIERAMYSNRDVLILDEATAALDSTPEPAVMDTVQKLGSHKTISTIVHRLSTARHCGCIYLLKRGHMMGSGSYDGLSPGNERLRAMHETAWMCLTESSPAEGEGDASAATNVFLVCSRMQSPFRLSGRCKSKQQGPFGQSR